MLHGNICYINIFKNSLILIDEKTPTGKNEFISRALDLSVELVTAVITLANRANCDVTQFEENRTYGEYTAYIAACFFI